MSETGMRPEPPAVSLAGASAFMAKLFDPLPDAEILDPDLAKIERKAAREARARVRREWDSRMMDAELLFYRMRVAQGGLEGQARAIVFHEKQARRQRSSVSARPRR